MKYDKNKLEHAYSYIKLNQYFLTYLDVFVIRAGQDRAGQGRAGQNQ